MDLTEEEFYNLRAEQNLLVDFANFPYRLIELLQRCLEFSGVEPNAAPFFAQLTVNPGEGTASLAFIERTTFRQVTQLALKLKSVENEVIKRKLAELLKNYRDQIALLQTQIYSSSVKAPPPSTMFKSVNTAGINTPTSTNNPNASNSNNNPNTTANNNIFASALVREKDEACAHLNQLYEVTKEAKIRVEDENSDLKGQIEILRGRFEDSQNEVLKANEIITKLQDEVRGLKAKLKSSSAIADDQMNAAEQLRTSNKRLQGELSELAEKAHEAKIQAEALDRDNRALRAQIDQLDRAIQQRDAIIAHHQRQANVKDLDRAIRDLDEAFTSQEDSKNQTDSSSGLVVKGGEEKEEDSGYVGSRIFDQTF